MRRHLVVTIAAILAACGSSSSSSPTYSVKDSAVAFDTTNGCSLPPSTTIGASVAVLNLTDYTSPTACASMTGDTVPAGGAAGAIVVVRADFTTPGGPAPGLIAESYPFYDIATAASGKLPPFDSLGKAAFFTGGLVKCGASGTDGGSSEMAVTGGTVTITSVSASQISGSVSASLAGGGTLGGSFTANVCATAPTVDVCAAIQNGSLNTPPPSCI